MMLVAIGMFLLWQVFPIFFWCAGNRQFKFCQCKKFPGYQFYKKNEPVARLWCGGAI